MTLRDLFDRIVNFIPRMMFPVYVEDDRGNLHEVEGVDFRNGCAGTVLTLGEFGGAQWDDELIELREEIAAAWAAADYDSEAHKVFDPTANIISIERAYALLQQTEQLLAAMYYVPF